MNLVITYNLVLWCIISCLCETWFDATDFILWALCTVICARPWALCTESITACDRSSRILNIRMMPDTAHNLLKSDSSHNSYHNSYHFHVGLCWHGELCELLHLFLSCPATYGCIQCLVPESRISVCRALMPSFYNNINNDTTCHSMSRLTTLDWRKCALRYAKYVRCCGTSSKSFSVSAGGLRRACVNVTLRGQKTTSWNR